MKFGIIGARLAGSYAAWILSRHGHEVILLDPSVNGEKACGGGITGKALLSMPWLHNGSLAHCEIRHVDFTTAEGSSASLPLRDPIRIFSRADLDGALRKQAIAAGTEFVADRAIRFTHREEGWTVTAASGASHEIDFLVGADGTNSTVRTAVAGKLTAADLSLALGFYLPGIHHPDRVVIVFQERGFQGYLWSFPRVDHASVGIIQCLEDARSADLRRRVNEFIASRYPAARWSERNFFAACVPSLRRATLASQRVCGRNWSLLGDAAGFADAITAEGIFFALRSAELFGTAVAGGNPLSYEDRWRSDFGAELDRAAAWRERFYSGTFLRRTVPGRAIQMIQRSGTIRRMTDSLISGRHSYRHLPSRLLARSPRILAETFRAALSRKHRQQAGKPPAAS